MKKLELYQIENISGGLNKSEFCKGFGAAQVVYTAGVLANLWNPIGWGGAVSCLLIDAYCLT